MAADRRLTLVADCATYGIAILFVLFSMLPILWLLLTSLKPEAEIVSAAVGYLPDRVTFEHYRAIWWQSNYPSLLLNSAVTTGLTVLSCLVAGGPAAYALSRHSYRYGRELLLAFLIVRMVPPVLLIVPLFVLMREAGLLDTNAGLALAHTSILLPLFVWLMKGFVDAVPEDLDDAARLDGCTRVGAMLRVVFPAVRIGILAATAFVAIASWNEFLFALMLTTSAGSRTWPVGLQLMIGEFQLPWGMLSAGGVLSILPVAVLFAFVQRTLVKGLGEGAFGTR
jgi:multiple sugar transport system permease protein